MSPDELSTLRTRLQEPEIAETILPDGTGVLLDIQGHQVLSLSRTAVYLVREIRSGVGTVDELASRLSERFDVSTEIAENDIDAFSSQLLQALTSATSEA